MKKTFLIFLICLCLITGCSKTETQIKPQKENQIIKEEKIEEPDEPIYQDDNPIKLSFYLDEGGSWHKIDTFYSDYQPIVDIEWFNIFLSDEEYIPITSIKNDWNNAYNKYENIEKYRIGYEISLKTTDGKEFDETITKPLDVYAYSFSDFLYMWVYDDVNATSSWYSHLEPNEYNENTWMSSVKFMATEASYLIDGPINVKIFTYDDDEDFDPVTGKYRGNSFTTLKIIKK